MVVISYNYHQEQYGDNNEKLVIDRLQKIINRNLNRSLYKFSYFDFYDETGNIFELKSRKIKFGEYKTALLDKYKIINIRHYPYTFFLYLYETDIYFIKYDNSLFKTFDVIDGIIHIPIEKLTKLDETNDLSVFNDDKINLYKKEFEYLLSRDYNNSLIYGSKF